MLVIINWPYATQVAFLTPETELHVILFTQREDDMIIFPNSRRLINTNFFPI